MGEPPSSLSLSGSGSPASSSLVVWIKWRQLKEEIECGGLRNVAALRRQVKKTFEIQRAAPFVSLVHPRGLRLAPEEPLPADLALGVTAETPIRVEVSGFGEDDDVCICKCSCCVRKGCGVVMGSRPSRERSPGLTAAHDELSSTAIAPATDRVAAVNARHSIRAASVDTGLAEQLQQQQHDDDDTRHRASPPVPPPRSAVSLAGSSSGMALRSSSPLSEDSTTATQQRVPPPTSRAASATVLLSRPKQALPQQQQAPASKQVQISDEQRSKMQARREHIVHEILSTEHKYVSSLEAIVHHFMEPLERSRAELGVQPEQLKAMFGNIRVILACNQQLLADLEQARQAVGTAGAAMAHVGGVFLPVVEYLRLYIHYVKSFASSSSVLRRLTSTNAAFARHVAQLEQQQQQQQQHSSGGLSLKDHLIMPVQRIPRYILLLQDLQRNTWPTHGDFEQLAVAVDKMRQLAEQLEFMQAKESSIVKITEIQAQLRSANIQLLQPGRRFIKEGAVLFKMDGESGGFKARWAFLFSDLLMLAKVVPQRPSKRGGSNNNTGNTSSNSDGGTAASGDERIYRAKAMLSLGTISSLREVTIPQGTGGGGGGSAGGGSASGGTCTGNSNNKAVGVTVGGGARNFMMAAATELETRAWLADLLKHVTELDRDEGNHLKLTRLPVMPPLAHSSSGGGGGSSASSGGSSGSGSERPSGRHKNKFHPFGSLKRMPSSDGLLVTPSSQALKRASASNDSSRAVPSSPVSSPSVERQPVPQLDPPSKRGGVVSFVRASPSLSSRASLTISEGGGVTSESTTTTPAMLTTTEGEAAAAAAAATVKKPVVPSYKAKRLSMRRESKWIAVSPARERFSFRGGGSSSSSSRSPAASFEPPVPSGPEDGAGSIALGSSPSRLNDVATRVAQAAEAATTATAAQPPPPAAPSDRLRRGTLFIYDLQSAPRDVVDGDEEDDDDTADAEAVYEIALSDSDDDSDSDCDYEAFLSSSSSSSSSSSDSLVYSGDSHTREYFF